MPSSGVGEATYQSLPDARRAIYQAGGVVLQDSGRRARVVAHDCAAVRLVRALVHLGRGQRQRIRQAHVAVHAIDPHRIPRRHRVDPFLPRAGNAILPEDPAAGGACQ
jgi:hypothetical protein